MTNQFAEKAAAQLRVRLMKQVDFLSAKSWPQNVDIHLGEAGKMILAAKNLGVEDLRDVNLEIPQDERDKLVKTVADLRHLDMAPEIRVLVEAVFKRAGVPEHYYTPTPVPATAEVAAE